jgi:hypothetical protein
MELSNFDALYLSSHIDAFLGTNLEKSVGDYDSLANLAFAIGLNELLEPLRFPAVVLTTPYVVSYFYQDKQEN